MRIQLGLMHPFADTPSSIVIDLGESLADKVVAIAQGEGGSMSLKGILPLPEAAVTFLGVDSAGADFQATDMVIDVSRRKFLVRGAHPDSNVEWCSESGWIDDIL